MKRIAAVVLVLSLQLAPIAAFACNGNHLRGNHMGHRGIHGAARAMARLGSRHA
jgi:hypothetical protein